MNSTLMSHPAWVCGLKQALYENELSERKSHPAWVCGLKLMNKIDYERLLSVTPCVGVWIETCNANCI